MSKYTPEELKFINHCFDTTLAHFANNPLVRAKDADIREAINYRNYNIGSIGVAGHKNMHSIFKKMGYCNNGKTTIDEQMQRDLQVEEEKVAQWGIDKDEMIAELRAVIKACQKQIDDLAMHDKRFKIYVQKQAKLTQIKFTAEMKEDRVVSQKKIINESKISVQDAKISYENLNVKQLRQLAKKKEIPNYYRMTKDILKKALAEA